MNTSRILFPLAILAVVAASACSSSTKGAGNTTEIMGTETPDAATPATPDPGPAPVTPPKKDAAPPDEPAPGECSSEATQTSCVTCCSNKHEDGAAVYFVALIDCMCLPANCEKECALTLCDPADPEERRRRVPDLRAAEEQRVRDAPSRARAPAIADCVAFDACVGKSDCPGK